MLRLGTYYSPWKESITVVLRKLGKPNYETPKAYRPMMPPMMLLSTIAKVLTAIIVMDITRLVEQHQLLPKTHFGGRPGRTTTDAIHYLVHRYTVHGLVRVRSGQILRTPDPNLQVRSTNTWTWTRSRSSPGLNLVLSIKLKYILKINIYIQKN